MIHELVSWDLPQHI